MEIWEPKPPGILWATPGLFCYGTPSYHFSDHMSHIDCLGLKPGVCDKRPTYNCISLYTAQMLFKNCIPNGVVIFEFNYPLLFPV
jgi:hypothetical protein